MTRRRWLVVAGGAVAIGLVAAGDYVLSVQQAGEDVRGSATVEFVTTDSSCRDDLSAGHDDVRAGCDARQVGRPGHLRLR